MSLTAFGGMSHVLVGSAGLLPYITAVSAATSITMDAANEACSFIGHLYWEDHGSHTVDTSGSSSLQWRSGNVTFASGSTTFAVGLAEVDAANGNATPRAVNSSDVITMDVSRSYTGGGGGISANSWHTSVPTSGTKTVAHGDLIALSFQMTARGGSDSVVVVATNFNSATQRPCVGTFLGSTYATTNNGPNCVVVASDGTIGFFYGTTCYNTNTNSSYNSGSTPNERGNVIIPPVPGKVVGISYTASLTSASDFELVLYSDPFGSPVAERTVSFDANTSGVNSGAPTSTVLFSSPYTFTASQPLAAILKPTTANNVTMGYISVASANHMKAFSLGTGAYAVNRSSGAFSVQNSNLDRYTIGLLVDSFDNGAGGGGGGQRVFGG